MKHQALFSSKDKSKKLKCHLLQFLFGALRVKRCKDNILSLTFRDNSAICIISFMNQKPVITITSTYFLQSSPTPSLI